MAANLRHAPAQPAASTWEALQAVWLVHMVFHATMNGNALGRLDQTVWPFLRADLAAGRLTLDEAAELVDCFTLKFDERAATTEDQQADHRTAEQANPAERTRHYTSSQLGSRRDRLDATNHWLQNIVVSGLTPEGVDGTNPLSYLLLESYRRNRMTNPLLTVRLHRSSPEALVRYTCEVLKDGGGMPALFNDEQLIPALEALGIPTPDARDYTNDGCWEVIIPGRTDFRFQRLSAMLCLEWALHRGVSRVGGGMDGLDTGDPRAFRTWEDVWGAFTAQLDHMVAGVVAHVVATLNDRSTIAPVPLLSALIDGAVESRRDMTAGGARYRTYGMLLEGAAHAIDSLTAIRQVVFTEHQATMAEMCDALDADFEGHGALRALLLAAPKEPYYNRIVNGISALNFGGSGRAANGTWTLRVCDRNLGTNGSLNRARLVLTSSQNSQSAAVCTSRASYAWSSNGDNTTFNSAPVGGLTLEAPASQRIVFGGLGTGAGIVNSFTTQSSSYVGVTSWYSLYMRPEAVPGNQPPETIGEHVTFTFSLPVHDL